ncbi:MAG TPA: glycine cleavage T C-terminal barrel domain-containing protein, partial [Acidimicrobiales bacterium]|nr:glycine cleavage T C-terminal barrel domain-containing protein [Acidimicrobiales bacterium]
GPEALSTLAALRAEVAAEEGIQVLTNAVVCGRYEDNWVSVMARPAPDRPLSTGPGGVPVSERLIKARAGTLVVAPGLIERPYVFDGNDRPGVMCASGVRRLINLHAVVPGQVAVVATANAEGDAAVADLERVGVRIARVVDARRGEDVVRALGGRGHGPLRAVTLGDGQVVEADLLVCAMGWTAPTSLLNMAGDRPIYSETAARFLPGGDGSPDVLPTGGLAGDGTLAELLAHARATGQVAAARAGHGRGDPVPALPVADHPARFRGPTHGIVDFSEDVSSKDLHQAVAEGYDSIELLKRYTTATMGPAQGKLETVNAVAALAEASGRTIAETGTTVWRPPYAPITLGALAGRAFEPVRHSPMQPWHEAHGARALVAGQWIRPDHYGDPAAEVAAVRSRVGLIDVSPLGKYELRGPDVAKLLNLVYVNKWSKLPLGAVRYGVMCAEDGVVMDDGVCGHLGPDHYLMSTTSSGAAGVGEWLEAILQGDHPDWAVHLVPRTDGYASINVAGPRSRELLSRVTTGVDLSREAFGYMQVRSGTIAGVSGCHLWRIGFTGELSYEIHVPASYGLQVWETLMEVGADLGVVPFGVEAQRIMRLEKGHFIVGQDTDGLTQAWGAGLEGLVKLDKEDFMGKAELAWSRREDGAHQALVGLQPLDPDVVPPEASLVMEGETTISGRITSSRASPTLSRSICLGVVAPHLAAPGTVVTVRLPDARRIGATVMAEVAHVDPEGVRLRG